MLVYLKRISKARPSTSLTAIVALLTGPPCPPAPRALLLMGAVGVVFKRPTVGPPPGFLMESNEVSSSADCETLLQETETARLTSELSSGLLLSSPEVEAS